MPNQTYLVKYLHAGAFIPFRTTWIREIQEGYFHSWLGITVQIVNKYFPNSLATIKKHLYQFRKTIDE